MLIMKWYHKFKVGQEVRVIKKISAWRAYDGGYKIGWSTDMDKTIGKFYKIKSVDRFVGYELWTKGDTYYKYNYWYPMESLSYVKGRQLLFDFMVS